MLRDSKNEVTGSGFADRWRRLRNPEWAAKYRRNWRDLGLPAKLLMLTAVFVMLAEVLIFLPSISTFRVDWLSERLTAAQLATLAAEGFPGGDVPSGLRAEMLRTAQVKAIASRRRGVRRLVLPVDPQMTIDAHYDLRQRPESWWGVTALRFEQIGDAIAVFFAPEGRTIRVLGSIGDDPDDLVEIVMPEAPLKAALRSYALNILGVSIVISLATAALVYFALSRLLVAPMMRITHAMVHFRQDPEDPSRIIAPSGRHDEIGTAERELAVMQRQLSGALLQKTRLAQLGLAVSKINHDLRGMLANAQLLSDRLTVIPDPTVQRFAPKLIASLDRAINFCNDTLRFGRAEEAAPRRELMLLKPAAEEVGEALGLPREGSIDFVLDMDARLRIDADRDHLFRILSNLVRNAIEAIEGMQGAVPGEIRIKGWRDGRHVFVEVSDNGPGVPQKARDHLFEAFTGSQRKGGTGLGLAIAAEIIGVHGGHVRLLDTPKGATFQFEIPDRGVQASHEGGGLAPISPTDA
ncbi:MAG: HAMP domain-containing sensor histidine kinase [Hyphomicrobium sp.]